MDPLYVPSWHLTATPPPLTARGVHLWRSPLTLTPTQRDRYWTLLAPDEQARVERLRFPQHRERAIAARGILRSLLGHYCACDPAQLQFAYGIHGKPSLAASQSSSRLEFNLSHAGDWLLCGMTSIHAIGVDLEPLRPVADLANLTQRFFAPSEYRTLQALPPDQQATAFFEHWTVKEAILKAIAQGLGGLETVELAFSQGQPRLVRVPPPPPLPSSMPSLAVDRATGWFVQSFQPVAGYIAAVAVATPTVDVQFWQWSEAHRET
jgi:4'-phosphopantetheinyl transferase